MKNDLKILHINSEKSWRGGENQMANLIQELSILGADNHICCRKDSKLDTYAKEKKIKTLSLSFSGLKFLNAISLKKYAEKENFDLIHTHSANAHTLAYYASLIGLKTPVIVSKRTDFSVKSKSKFNFKNLKFILCVSNKIKEITSRAVIKKAIVQTVYSGIDLERFEGNQHSLHEKLQINKK